MRAIFIISLLLTASVTPALDSLFLAGCSRTGNSQSLTGFEDSLVSVLSPRLLNYGLIFLKNTADEPADNISTMKCDIISSAENMKIRFTITSSKTGDTYEREIPWDTAQTARQNLTLISSKLIRLFEENLLARVQLQSEPPEADLLIDNSIKAVTPFETFLPLGRHSFLLTLAEHDTLDTKESVAPGNNRFSFLLKPKTVKPPPERISVVIREKEHSTLPWFITSGVLLTVGIIAEAFYINTDKEYDNLVSNDQSEYDNLNREANRWILVRNVTGITCSITTCYGLYKFFSK